MNTIPQRQTRAAFSLIELLVVIVVMAVCVGILLPALMRARPHPSRLYCVNQLKQVGLSCRIWANDYGDRFPPQVPTNEGGTLEFVSGPNAFRHFQAMSNELSTPKILLCPQDRERWIPATSFRTDFNNSKLSYFF